MGTAYGAFVKNKGSVRERSVNIWRRFPKHEGHEGLPLAPPTPDVPPASMNEYHQRHGKPHRADPEKHAASFPVMFARRDNRGLNGSRSVGKTSPGRTT
jgi:hypothetical protein